MKQKRFTKAHFTAAVLLRRLKLTNGKPFNSVYENAGMIFMILCVFVLPGSSAGNQANADTEFILSDQCPGSFEKTETGQCVFRSFYQQYDSPTWSGGLRAALPQSREGFSPEQIDLGRYLFFDPILSREGKLSCAHCHHPDYGLSDGLGRSIGKDGQGVGPARYGGSRLPRSAPTLWNVGFLNSLFWDGRASSLEEQAEGPLFSSKEMNNTRKNLEGTLNNQPVYRKLFEQAFGLEPQERIATLHVSRALTAFESTLVSFNSRYDQYAHGNESALSEEEIAGHNVFRSFVTRCSQCHTPPLFTNSELAVIGVPEPDGAPLDAGAQLISGEATLRGGFKIPSLRNIALTAPYMHAGNFNTLQEVIDFYNNKRGHAVPDGENLSLHWHIHLSAPTLSVEDTAALIAFLNSLTDESMMPAIPQTVPSGLPVVAVNRNKADSRIASHEISKREKVEQ